MAADVQRVLAAIGEPTRLRIVELLATGPRTVGEVAAALGALQPQTTKHLQVLEAAGVVRVHRLGRRRVVRLDRDTLARLAGYVGRLAEQGPDDAELDGYERAVALEAARAPHDGETRTLRFERALPAAASAVWEAWTDPARAAAWWAPRHFTVDAFEIAPQPGAPVRVVLREGDGATYESRGRVVEVEQGRRLVFTLAPVDAADEPLFHATHTLTLDADDGEGDGGALVVLTVEVADVRPGAAAAVAGLEPGWRQLLDALESRLQV